MAAVALPTDLLGSLLRRRHSEETADTLAHRRAAEAAMNRLLAAALATGWTGPELGSVLGTTARNVYLRAQRGRWLGGCFGLALPTGRHIPMLGSRTVCRPRVWLAIEVPARRAPTADTGWPENPGPSTGP